MYKIAMIDIYKKSISRISKDTAGGYGTENDFGIGLVPGVLTRLVKKSLFWPNLMFIQLTEELSAAGFETDYYQFSRFDNANLDTYDFIFVCSSIVCFETELAFIREKAFMKKVFLCGEVFLHSGCVQDRNICILSGGFDYLVGYMKTTNTSLQEIFEKRRINVPLIDGWRLKLPDWFGRFRKYTRNYLFQSGVYIPYLTSRGCPYSCYEYCTYPLSQGRKVQHNSINNVVQDMVEISKHNRFAHVVFRDPVFSINTHYTKQLLIELERQSLHLRFTVELHLRNIDDELIDLMVRANVKVVKFGIESSLPTLRDSVNRYSVENDVQARLVKKLHARGLKTIAMYILCLPSDDKHTIKTTIDYSIALDTTFAQFSIFTPYPGTPYYKNNVQKIIVNKFEDFTQYKLVYKHHKYDQTEARKALGNAYTRFYFHKLRRMII